MTRSLSVCGFALMLTGACFAQEWELGFAGGGSFYPNKTVTQDGGSATTGFKTGPAASVFAVQNMYSHLSGEFRYTFQYNSLKLSSGGTDVSFSAQSHAVHYDLMFLGGSADAAVRPFVVVGGGVKVYRGTGKENAEQPLGQFAALTHTQEVKGLVTFGGGIRAKLGSHTFLYAEARDYLTPFPTQVIAPVPPSKISGWVHDFVPMIGISFGF